MLDEDFGAFRNGQRFEGGIRTAVLAWCNDPAAAKQLYGPIASWNTSEASAPHNGSKANQHPDGREGIPLNVVNSFLASAPSRTRR